MLDIRRIILQSPTFEEISDWAFSCSYFKGIPTVHRFVHPERYNVPTFFFEAVEKSGKRVVIRGEEYTFRMLCGVYMQILQALNLDHDLLVSFEKICGREVGSDNGK